MLSMFGLQLLIKSRKTKYYEHYKEESVYSKSENKSESNLKVSCLS